MKNLVAIGVVCLALAGCAGNFQRYLPVGAAAIGGAACIPAGPEAAVLCATTAAAVTEVAVPSKQQRALSDNPAIAAKQIEAEEKEALFKVIETWGIYIIIALALVFWLLPDPMKITDRFRRKEQ